MNNETESSGFKRFAAGSIVIGIVLFSFGAFSGMSVKTAMPFSLVSMLWFFLGGLAFQTSRFAGRMEARITALETKMSDPETAEKPLASSTEN